MTYSPRPNTVAFRVLEWFKQNPGAAVLPKDLEPVSGKKGESLMAYLLPALHHGALIRVWVHGSGREHWALPGTPSAPPPKHRAPRPATGSRAPRQKQPVAPGKALPPPRSIFDLERLLPFLKQHGSPPRIVDSEFS
jgi:hypothetical protein